MTHPDPIAFKFHFGAVVAGMCVLPIAQAQNQFNVAVPPRGGGSYSATFHYEEVTRRRAPQALGGALIDMGDVTLRSAVLEFDYGLTDSLAVSVALPYVSNRYIGDTPHDPSRLQNDHGERLLDDGTYHGNWADWNVGLRYLWKTDPIAITTYLGYHSPASDYPLFTLTAAGTQRSGVDVGLNLGGRIPGPWKNLFWQAGYVYSYMEKTRPEGSESHRVNHSVANLQVGYRIDPQWSLLTTWRYRNTHHALQMPRDFNPPFTDDLFYYHDQLFPIEQSVFQVELAYQINDHYAATLGYGRTLHVAFGQEIKGAASFGISRGF